MENNQLMNEFDELIREFIESKDENKIDAAGVIMRMMFKDISAMSPQKAEEYIDMFDGMMNCNNFLSESMAKEMVNRLESKSGEKGGKWSPDVVFDAVRRWGDNIESTPYYNKWALYFAMNTMYSDHKSTIIKWLGSDNEKIARMCYDLAIDNLTDKDHPDWLSEKYL